MGVYGTIVIYISDGTPPTTEKECENCVQRAARVLADLGLVEGTGEDHFRRREPVVPDSTESFSTSIQSQDGAITKKLDELVYTACNRQWWRDPYIYDPQPDDGIAVPFITITASSDSTLRGQLAETHDEWRGWLAIEFSHEARFNEEIHRIKDPQHAIFAALNREFNSPIKWAIEAS